MEQPPLGDTRRLHSLFTRADNDGAMKLFETLLVPVDGSTPSAAGADLATALAAEYGGTLVFVNVVDLGSLAATSDYAAIDAAAVSGEAREIGERIASAAAETARTKGVAARSLVLDGPVVDTLIEAVTGLGISAVVICSHGRGGLPRAILGSTTEGLLRRSPVPVIVAPHVHGAGSFSP